MIFSELVDIGELSGLCESFTALTGAVTAILDIEGNVLVSTGWRPLCTQFHRVHPLTAERCRESDTVLAGQLAHGDAYNVYQCKNGLVDVAVPITVGGAHVANFFTGQFFFEPPDTDTFIRQAKMYGFDEHAYLAAVSEVPVFSEAEIQETMEFLTRLARVMGEMGLAKERLKEANQRFSIASDSAKLGVWDWRIPENRLIWDARMFTLHGVDEAEFPANFAAWLEVLHPDDRLRCVAETDQALRGDKAFDTDFRVVWPTGEVRHIKATALVLRDTQGAPLRMTGVNFDITDCKQAEITLQSVMEAANEAIVVTDPAGNITYWNRAAHHILGYSAEDVLGKNLHRLMVPDRHLPAHHAAFPAFQRSGQGSAVGKTRELHARRKDGQEIAVEVSLASVRLHDGWHAIGIIRDITERRQSEEKLRLAASVFTHASEGIMIAGADGTILDVNDAFVDITGYSRDEVLGQNARLLKSDRQGKAFYAAMWNELSETGHWRGDIWNRRKNGEVYPETLDITAVHDAQGVIQHYLAMFSDISTLKAQQAQLEYVVHYDALTRLPNRVLLADRLQQAMAQANRRQTCLVVAYLDLDGFKEVNDAHGHEVGDQLLITLALRLLGTLREADTLARMGGDEFVAVLPDQATAEASVPMLNRLLFESARPIHIGSCVHQVSASLGVAIYPQNDEVDADQLLRQADQAMYQAKLAGKNRYHFFDAEQDRNVRGRHESLEHIRRALVSHELVLHYQPKVNMRTGQVIGVEALIRWQHPENGLLSPAVFLPVIEEHALAISIGEWVIHSALTQIERWQNAGLYLPVSVNIGAYQLQQPDFADRVRAILAEHPEVTPGRLMMEVLETSALEDLTHVSRVIEACRAMGIGFALDDFGTGYSSLTYLKRLPVRKLKIDQSFVRDMLDDPDDLAILEGILGLARAFRRQVIAEGVETVAHGELLLKLGCELAQGYGIARPMPAADLPGWVATWRPDPAWSNRQPAHRDDLPLLFAQTEHRAWLTALENYLKGIREVPPALDPRQCRFGQWLYTEGRKRHEGQPVFQTIERLHREMHDRAAALWNTNTSGKDAASAGLAEVRELLETLINEEKALLG